MSTEGVTRRDDPKQIYNADHLLLWNICNRVRKEMTKSQSSGADGIVLIYDRNRLKTYCHQLSKAKKWIQSRTPLDLVETHPNLFDVDSRFDVPHSAESEAINQVVRLIDAYMNELVHSASARMGSGIIQPGKKTIVFDGVEEEIEWPSTGLRLDLIQKQLENFVKTYVETATPGDYPESSPSQPTTEHGAGGVDPA